MSVEASVRLADGDHVVQFYQSDVDLTELVGPYLAASVLDGDAVIVIAVPAHRHLFSAALAAAGVDIEAALVGGGLIFADAVEMLDRLMVNGSLDVTTFDEVIGGLLRQKAVNGRPVRVFGEMVALLWGADNVVGAIELEQSWNGLGAQVPFSLFCTYPAEMVSGPDAADAFAEMCHLHSDVIAGAPTPVGVELTRRFTRTPHGPRLARTFLADALRRWGRADLVDNGVLVVSELAANAVIHAGSEFTVGLSSRGEGVRVEVADSSSEPPKPRELGSIASGRGLHVVGDIADRWGHNTVYGGKVVWAELGVGDVGMVPERGV